MYELYHSSTWIGTVAVSEARTKCLILLKEAPHTSQTLNLDVSCFRTCIWILSRQPIQIIILNLCPSHIVFQFCIPNPPDFLSQLPQQELTTFIVTMVFADIYRLLDTRDGPRVSLDHIYVSILSIILVVCNWTLPEAVLCPEAYLSKEESPGYRRGVQCYERSSENICRPRVRPDFVSEHKIAVFTCSLFWIGNEPNMMLYSWLIASNKLLFGYWTV